VFAEMGSLNPVIVTLGAVESRGPEIAERLAGSAADFGGQLCTKPGIVFVPAGAAGAAFKTTLARLLDERSQVVLLNERIYRAFRADVDRLSTVPGVELLTADVAPREGFYVRPQLFAARARELAASPSLREEHFGPALIALDYDDEEDLGPLLRSIGGQLTATVHSEPWERSGLDWLVALCTELAGRVIFDGMPTGVSVCWAMQHGGPFPASSSGEGSVGMMSIRRFTRPVAFQNMPPELLHPALQEENPLALWRRVDGRLTR
jgi:acyl-CoA reductase-like NAD-dependent aldehyde dehydrogenase